MPNYKVAHVMVQGVSIIIVPVAPPFLLQERSEQDAVVAELQKRATAGGIQGNVVPVWDMGGGRMGFRAPMNQHPFFKQINLEFVKSKINKELYW